MTKPMDQAGRDQRSRPPTFIPRTRSYHSIDTLGSLILSVNRRNLEHVPVGKQVGDLPEHGMIEDVGRRV